VCDNSYSDSLKSCPHCGRTVNEQVLGSIRQFKVEQEKRFEEIRREAVAAAVKAVRRML